MNQYFSFQVCERVRHLGCLFAQAVASRYDKSFFIQAVFGDLYSYEAYELFLEGRNRKMAMQYAVLIRVVLYGTVN